MKAAAEEETGDPVVAEEEAGDPVAAEEEAVAE